MEPKKKDVEVFLFIDALGWKIVNDFDFLKTELPYRGPARMQFGYSSTAIPTILSGCRPQEHGHLSFYFFDRKNSPFRLFGLLPLGDNPRSLWNRGRVRGIISRWFKRLMRYTGYFQLYNMPFRRLPYFDYCEKRDIFVAGGLSPCKNLCDVLEASGLRYHISDWRKSEEANLTAAEALMAAGGTDFYFIYTAALDGMLHQKIGQPDAIAEKLKFYEAHVRKMLEILRGAAGRFTLTIFSDHGMTPLAGTADVKGAVEKLGLAFGKDYVATYDSTMFRVWFLKDGVRDTVMRAVNADRFPGRWVSPEDKKRYGIDFADHKYGDEIFLMNPGIQIAPSDMGGGALPGMHGFLPEDEHSTAAVLSTAPFPPVEEVADFFGLMRRGIDRLRAVRD